MPTLHAIHDPDDDHLDVLHAEDGLVICLHYFPDEQETKKPDNQIVGLSFFKGKWDYMVITEAKNMQAEIEAVYNIIRNDPSIGSVQRQGLR